jgi:hypothetical protein
MVARCRVWASHVGGSCIAINILSQDAADISLLNHLGQKVVRLLLLDYSPATFFTSKRTEQQQDHTKLLVRIQHSTFHQGRQQMPRHN